MKRTILRTLLRAMASYLARPSTPLRTQRAALARLELVTRPARGLLATDMVLAGRPVRRFAPPQADAGRTLLYLHGGAYISGGLQSHAAIASQLCEKLQATTWLLDYRLAPEHPYPAAVVDALAAYRELLATGVDPARTVIAGDSAGGGLTLATALAIRDANLPLPAALALISPWVDVTLSGDSMKAKAALDPMINREWLDWAAEQYCATVERTNPGVSPLFGDLAGLPPMVVHVGADEVLLDDALRLAQRVGCELQVYEGLWHVFQMHAGVLPESDQSLTGLAAFLARRMAG